MCQEIKYQGKCNHKHMFSANPPTYVPCRDYRAYNRAKVDRERQDLKDKVGPEPKDPRLPPNSCIDLEIYHLDTRRWECKMCQPEIALQEFNASKIIMEAVDAEYIKGGRQADQVAIPEHTQALIHRYHGLFGSGDPANETTFRKVLVEGGHHSRTPSPFSSKPSSSSQQTNAVYDQDGNLYQEGVSATDPERAADLDTLEGEWWMLNNNPDITEEMRREFLPELQHKTDMLKYAHTVRKPPSVQPE